MDLKSGYPFWAVKNGLMHAFPKLKEDQRADVLVIGGGITGALIADELTRHDHSVVVVEERDVGWGSSCASTALLQYEIDTHMVDLAARFGESDAALAYTSCAQAIDGLGALAAAVGDVDFAPMESLYFASKGSHENALREEFALRLKTGFAVTLLEPAALQKRFGITAPVAILSAKAARIDPYRMAYRLLMRAEKSGAKVYDHSKIFDLKTNSRGIVASTQDGICVRAKHAVFAAGYASQRWLPEPVARNRSSYAVISDPIDAAALGELKNTMVWESARPYLYLRSTGDGRLLIGGEDDSFDLPARRDAVVGKKSALLLKRFARLFPNCPIEPAFSWAGTFAETADGLPYFGAHPVWGPRVHFGLAYGGNGITYSQLGAGLLRALIERKRHPLAALFGFGRLQR